MSKVEYIDHLKKIANNSDIYYQHAAGIIQNNKLVSSGINKFAAVKSPHYKRTIHAEISAFYNLSKKNCKGLDMIVIRIKNNTLKNSRPCNNCIDKLTKLGIRKVYYSNENGIIVHEFVENMEKIHVSSGYRLLY